MRAEAHFKGRSSATAALMLIYTGMTEAIQSLNVWTIQPMMYCGYILLYGTLLRPTLLFDITLGHCIFVISTFLNILP